jgi:hypothetical protein
MAVIDSPEGVSRGLRADDPKRRMRNMSPSDICDVIGPRILEVVGLSPVKERCWWFSMHDMPTIVRRCSESPTSRVLFGRRVCERKVSTPKGAASDRITRRFLRDANNTYEDILEDGDLSNDSLRKLKKIIRRIGESDELVESDKEYLVEIVNVFISRLRDLRAIKRGQ